MLRIPALRIPALLALLLLVQCGKELEEAENLPRSLFDRPLGHVERAQPAEGSTLALLRAPDATIWFRERKLMPWDYVLTSIDETTGRAVWTAAPRAPLAGAAQSASADSIKAKGARAAFQPSSEAPDLSAVEPGQFVIDQGGIHTVTTTISDKPARIRPAYPTPAAAVRARIATPLPVDGGHVTPAEVAMRGETRRAVRVETGTVLTWQTEKHDANAALRFGYGLQTTTVTHKGDVVEFLPKARAGARFSVHWMSAGSASVELWSAELSAEDAGVLHEATIAALPGPGDLSLRVDTLAQNPKHAAHPVWFEPSLTTSRSADERPNVLLIVLDTLRADRLGCYGYERATSPYIDAFAKEGVVFEDAWSSAPWTLPSHASLLSSLYANQHGVFSPGDRLGSNVVTVAEALWHAGYDTAAFTEGGYVCPQFGLAQGFESFWIHTGDVTETFAKASEWIDGRDRPFFAFVQTYKVHAPYDPEGDARESLVRPYAGDLPETISVAAVPNTRKTHDFTPADTRYLSDLYDAEILELDGALETLLEGLRASGVLENTVVILTSDHGEEFNDHGQFGHGNSLYQEQIGVPLIVRGPGRFEGGRRVSRPVLGIDIPPTIALATGTRVPEVWSGAALQSAPPAGARPLWVPYRPERTEAFAVALRQGDDKFVSYPSDLRPGDPNGDEVLFELSGDPAEHEDLWSARPADQGVWRRLVERLHTRFPAADPPERAASNADIRAQLNALGYGGDD